MATREIRSDECRIEMGNKPEGTKYIEVQLNYFETLKTEYRSDERVFTLTVPRHNKRLVADNVQNVSQIFDTSRYIDEIEIIEPHPSNTSENPTYKILKIEWDDKRWEINSMGNTEVIQGTKWKFSEIKPGRPSGLRRNQNGEVLPDLAPQIGQVKNDLELRFFMRKNVAPAINIEYLNDSELEAIVSVELSEENIRQQLSNIANVQQQNLHGDERMEYDSNAAPRSPVVSTQPMEYVFLIDCGRSMEGKFMDSTKLTMNQIINSVDPGSKVLFCQFGSQHEFQPRQNGHGMRDGNWITIDLEDDEQEETIKTNIAGFEANFDSKILRAPLVDIFHLRRNPGVFRNIIIFTDGVVSNTKEIHELVRNEAIRQEGYLRFFVVGIGSGVCRNLCDGIAKYGRGSNYYVLDDDRIQAKASLILEEASRPSIYLQRIALPSTLDRLGYSVPIELDMSIFEVKRIYLRLKSNNQISVYQNLQQAVRNGSFSLTINGTRVPMQISQDNMQRWYSGVLKLAAFWAKQEINYLEDYDMNADRKKAIQVDASIKGGFLSSKHTAFVGVMDRVGQQPQNTPPRIHELHVGSNTSSGNDEIFPNSGQFF
ncbi:unnamed protein product [Oikopleura dioica]|uniref:VWFA domain-containing protein n=1 Tax=Oikopleura dioica TaxID=34765 RepID=E4YRE5_OIKDI|nr:unnamed protein product [Oikopleura dioica]